jgi:hypothetical protein
MIVAVFPGLLQIFDLWGREMTSHSKGGLELQQKYGDSI